MIVLSSLPVELKQTLLEIKMANFRPKRLKTIPFGLYLPIFYIAHIME